MIIHIAIPGQYIHNIESKDIKPNIFSIMESYQTTLLPKLGIGTVQYCNIVVICCDWNTIYQTVTSEQYLQIMLESSVAIFFFRIVSGFTVGQ